jgi:hypothetical protein
MSTASLSFTQLPAAGEVKNGDFFVIEDITGAKKLNYQNLIFGLDNVTFATTISSQSTDIATLSTNVNNLSSELYGEVDTLTSLINTTVQSATANFLNVMYPINCIIYNTDGTNPGTLLYGTSWDQVAQGLFIAGVGSGVDKNGTGLTVGPENAATNFNTGEYVHTLLSSELPSHQHNFKINLQTTGNTTSYQNGPQNAPAWRLDTLTTYTTDPNTGGDGAHNNIPPFYGMYVWKRVS